MPETKYFSHELTLSAQSEPAGTKFPAKLAYWALGDASKPAIMMPSCFGGTLESTSAYLYNGLDGAPPAFSTKDYFVVIVGLMGGSESSSPSNQAAPFDGPRFPKVTYEDNIRLQYALCQELGIKKLHAYIGFSMGGQQAYHMAALFPDFVERICCLAGSAKTSWHNWCFLEGPKAALTNSIDFHDGHYKEPVKKGTRAWSRVYSTWALSQPWFRTKQWETLGFPSLDAYLDKYWGGGADANNLLCMTYTWQHGDIGLYYPEDKGDLAKTLARIKAKCLVMPARTDMYFPPEDSEFEVEHLKNGELKVIETVYGHVAGGGSGTTDDSKFISEHVAKLIKE